MGPQHDIQHWFFTKKHVRWKDSICCSEQMIDEGNLLRFVQARNGPRFTVTLTVHLCSPADRMKGRAMNHPLPTWVARSGSRSHMGPTWVPAVACPHLALKAGKKHWPELMELHSASRYLLIFAHWTSLMMLDLGDLFGISVQTSEYILEWRM